MPFSTPICKDRAILDSYREYEMSDPEQMTIAGLMDIPNKVNCACQTDPILEKKEKKEPKKKESQKKEKQLQTQTLEPTKAKQILKAVQELPQTSMPTHFASQNSFGIAQTGLLAENKFYNYNQQAQQAQQSKEDQSMKDESYLKKQKQKPNIQPDIQLLDFLNQQAFGEVEDTNEIILTKQNPDFIENDSLTDKLAQQLFQETIQEEQQLAQLSKEQNKNQEQDMSQFISALYPLAPPCLAQKKIFFPWPNRGEPRGTRAFISKQINLQKSTNKSTNQIEESEQEKLEKNLNQLADWGNKQSRQNQKKKKMIQKQNALIEMVEEKGYTLFVGTTQYLPLLIIEKASFNEKTGSYLGAPEHQRH